MNNNSNNQNNFIGNENNINSLYNNIVLNKGNSVNPLQQGININNNNTNNNESNMSSNQQILNLDSKNIYQLQENKPHQQQEGAVFINDRYEKLQKLGEGTYGVVFKAFDHAEKKFVAIKKIRIEDDEDEGVPATALREMSVLKRLDHPNIVKLLDIVLSREETAVFLVFDFYEQDLRQYIKNFRKCGSQIKMQFDFYREKYRQLLCAVDYCHSLGIQHRDLKPHNILVDNNGNLKVADFGLARAFNFPLKEMTREIVTLWYRSPELLLGSKHYDMGVDMWSIGCILAEFSIWKPVFSGDSQIDQIFKIFQYGGTPDENSWPGVTEFKDYSKQFPKFKKQTQFFQRSEYIDTIGKEGTHLLESILQLDPNRRINCQEALQHPFFNIQSQEQIIGQPQQ